MKSLIPVTLDDLEATALDHKLGFASYKFVEVIWNGVTTKFSYYYKGREVSKLIAGKYLMEKQQ